MRHRCLMIFALSLPVLSGCRLTSGDGKLHIDMPNQDVPLNAAIVMYYEGEHYIDPSFVQPGFVNLAVCETETAKESNTQDSSNPGNSNSSTTDQDKKDASEPKTPSLPVYGYLAAYPDKKTKGPKVSRIVFIPRASESGAAPLMPATRYCLSTQDLADEKGSKIVGLGNPPFELTTQDNNDDEPFFRFSRATQLNSRFSDGSGVGGAYTSLEFQGENENDYDEDGEELENEIKTLDPSELITFVGTQPYNPYDISSGTYACQKPNDKLEKDSDCGGWIKIPQTKAYLIETLKKSEDGFVRIHYNQYAFHANYIEKREYSWRLGLKSGNQSTLLPVPNNARFQIRANENLGETAKEDLGTSLNEAFWRKTLNKLYEKVNIKEGLGDEDPVFFISLETSP